MLERIDILLASRGRPARLREMLESAHRTAAEPAGVRVIVRLDEDDAFLTDYQALAGIWGAAVYVLGPKRYVPALVAELVERSDAPIELHAADDVVFLTPGWDSAIRRALAAWPDGLGVVYTNDGLDRRKCQHFACTRVWMDTVGTAGWSTLRHFFLDQWHEDLARAVGRLAYLGNVVLEHRHFKHRDKHNQPLAPRDETYAEKRAENWSDRDANAYEALAGMRRLQIERLRGALRGAS